MRLVNKKEPWARFSLKVVAMLGVGVIAVYAFNSRFEIRHDSQEEKCIVGHSFFLIDRKAVSLKKGNIYAYTAKGLDPIYPDGTMMAKYLVGSPGDTIEIREDQVITVNEERVGEGLLLANRLGVSAQEFIGKKVLLDGEYWFMGTAPLSFDSRYWGVVNEDQIVGKAIPIF